jgi:hypothetical protein
MVSVQSNGLVVTTSEGQAIVSGVRDLPGAAMCVLVYRART